jgi:hypothetical protein
VNSSLLPPRGKGRLTKKCLLEDIWPEQHRRKIVPTSSAASDSRASF